MQARGCIARLFEEAGIPYREIHSRAQPAFPGNNPEPIEPHVDGLQRMVTEGGYDAGFATDGDADRVGAVDRTGTVPLSTRTRFFRSSCCISPKILSSQAKS